MEESGSEGLDDLIFARKDTFFKDVDYICISDNYWLGKKKPCITYGLRGICYFFIEVPCRARPSCPQATVSSPPASSRVGSRKLHRREGEHRPSPLPWRKPS